MLLSTRSLSSFYYPPSSEYLPCTTAILDWSCVINPCPPLRLVPRNATSATPPFMPGSVLCCTGLHWVYFPLLSIADPSVFFISLSSLVSDHLPHLESRSIISGCDPFSFPPRQLAPHPCYVIPLPSWPVPHICIQNVCSALIFRNAYDEDAARDVVAALPPICIATFNIENAFVWTSTRLSRARTQS
jgi:hypothetical protein